MKKFLCVSIAFLIIFTLAGCAAKVDVDGEAEPKADISDSAVGVWTIETVKFKDVSDPIGIAMNTILKSKFIEGAEIRFEDDNTATVNGEEVTYLFENNTLTLTWDSSKNFMFKVSGNAEKLDLVIDNVADVTILKK